MFLDICFEAKHPAVLTRYALSVPFVNVHFCVTLQSEFPSKSFVANPADKWLQRPLSVHTMNVLPQCSRVRKSLFAISTFHIMRSDSGSRMSPFMDTSAPITAKRFSASIEIKSASKWFGVTEPVSIQMIPSGKGFAASLDRAHKAQSSGSRDKVGVRGSGSVQRQCREGGGSDIRGVVCVHHGGH